MFQVFALPLSRTELFLYFQWVAYKKRDTRTITIHVNKTLSPFFMLNLPFLGEGSQHQALAFISQQSLTDDAAIEGVDGHPPPSLQQPETGSDIFLAAHHHQLPSRLAKKSKTSAATSNRS